MNLLNQVRFPNSTEPIGSDQFVRKWLTHIEDFTGIHDRRICIMGNFFKKWLPVSALRSFIIMHLQFFRPASVVWQLLFFRGKFHTALKGGKMVYINIWKVLFIMPHYWVPKINYTNKSGPKNGRNVTLSGKIFAPLVTPRETFGEWGYNQDITFL